DTAQETFAGIRVVKSFGKEWWFIKKFADTNEDYQNANMALVRLYGVFFPFISFLSGLTFLIALLAGGSRVVTGQMSPGAMVALFRYLQMLVWPLMGAGFVAHMIQRGAVSLGRVYEIMDALPSIASPAAPETAFSQDAPAITVTDLTFRYPEGRTALEGVSLTIAAGSFVGITGRTGAGKSTLIKTFTRTVDPPANTVRVKGVGVEKWDLEKLRACFGVTPQDSYLFSDSIKRNICYGLEGTLNEEGAPACQGAANALSLAALERDMASFALGWDTVIGERGLTLSGGQKQRVAVARALAVEPEILILDDSLSAVDRETEGQVLKRLLKARKGRTTIIISHRISTLKDADKVVVLDKGRVAEQGAPAELMAQGGYFSRMAAIQDPPGGGTADKKEGPYG
ncbi:MAG: ABC transporter ATP-binding protein/permease, partial [Spirochaetaceae bacterium]|nr:ABC transporter ATP-binding protein/permease [Spirochaetaceae bacterium]